MDDLAERLTEFSRAGSPRGAAPIWRAAQRRLRRRRVARATALTVTAAGLITVIAIVATHNQTHAAQTPPTTAAPPHTNPQQTAAIALGHKLLDDVVLPPDTQPFTGVAPAGLHAPLEWPGARQLVFAHRLWTVTATPYDMWHWFQAHVPFPGQVSDSTGTQGTVRTWGFEDDLRRTPTNISQGQLSISIGGPKSGPAVIRADTVVGWTKPRPAIAFVPATDRTVTVTVVHIIAGSSSTGPLGKRVRTSDPAQVQNIIRTFNQLHVEPPPEPNPGGPPGCGTAVYRVAFSASPTAAPDLVATVGRCGGVEVTVGGHAVAELAMLDDLPYQDFAGDAARLLGFTEPHFG